jgi:BASS family bile acid:Na+ symporter
MEVMSAIFNVILVVFIVSTMLSAGLTTTFDSLVGVFRNVWLVLTVVVTNIVVVPLLGLGIAELFSLGTSAYVAMVLIACSPGAPFGAKLAMTQRGEVVAGSVLQVGLAAIGSITFPVTANWLLQVADLGSGVSLPVGDLVKTVVFLQLLPFGVGLSLRHWSPETAGDWRPAVLRTSALTFPAVLVLSLLGSWQQLVDLIGSGAMAAGLLFTALAIVAGTLLTPGPLVRRTTLGLVAPMRNAGPVMAAVGIAFDNEPAMLAAVTSILLMQLVVALPVASFLARKRLAAEPAVGEADAARPSTLGPEADVRPAA